MQSSRRCTTRRHDGRGRPIDDALSSSTRIARFRRVAGFGARFAHPPGARRRTIGAAEEQTMSDAIGPVSRRELLKALGAAGTIGALTAWPRRTAQAVDKLVVGVIYVGPRDDYGYNQAQAQAAAAIKKLPGVVVVEQEKVPETTDVQKTMGSMIEQDGATLLFPTSFGYFDPHILRAAEKYPKVRFAHCGGLWTEGKHPKNAASYFGYIDECQYLNGVVAGHTTKSKKLGFIAAKPIPQVLRNINAFTMGARSIDPKITTQLIVTGDWSLPVKEAEADR